MDQDSIILLPNEHWNNRSIKETRNRKPIVLLFIQTVLLLIYTIFIFVFDFTYSKTDNPILSGKQSSTVIYFSHLAIRLLCLVFKLYLDRYYHSQLKLYGYHQHHSKSTFLSELMHIIFNKLTLLLLLNSSIYQVIGASDDIIHLFGLAISQTELAKIIVVVLSSIITIISGKKLRIDIVFQREQTPPDTLTDNDINDTRTPSTDVGLRSSNLTEELLEKQYEMIVNLKLQNDHLRQLLMKAHENAPTVSSVRSESNN